MAVSISNDLFASGMEMLARSVAAFRVAIRFDLLLLSAVALPAYRQSPSISVYFGYTTVLHYSGQKRFFPANSSLHAEFFRKFGVTHRVLPFGRPIRPVKDHKNRPAQ